MKEEKIRALILAAGKSTRMGRPKMDLPWENTTILGAVIEHLYKGGIQEMSVVYNPEFKPCWEKDSHTLPIIEWIKIPFPEKGEMLESIKTGLNTLGENFTYAMICLGDQPGINPKIISGLINCAVETHADLIFPSYNMRRGHPWMVRKNLWHAILSLDESKTVQTFIQQYEDRIKYVNFYHEQPVDIDTPDDYDKFRPDGEKRE
ncbi:NTP transferase domain-containing protein [Leptolinea tardivitalis]|uniref:MobA-like NTP transferase domain-containing protein n=1 Tax=Leptolinea tardivitalis TaxID=229920 RepID=A0A0P6X480_9CHLR|nr:nucleotidyltransferase family protein [Leptolinea tardivitalis]KPL74683.1 hypothetical protein ADM99_00885 [Leptolinea tardivitalis]GAP22970.1 uncharacterized MobA-related protein [Leptolinea tardivitalis]